jgi:putative endonuclease
MSLLARVTRRIVRLLDGIAEKVLPPEKRPSHQKTGRAGEEVAYFHLRELGYVMVARNYRSSRRRGEVDLIGWDDDVLCFVEVKTRTTRDVKPAEAAVDEDKRRELAGMAREYLRNLPEVRQWRFDVVSVYMNGSARAPEIEIFKNAFSVS